MRKLMVVMVLTLAATSAFADGFALFDQSARAAGMGGAYVAQATDPSGIFYNPGALALMKKPKGLAAGVNTTSLQSFQFQGLAPGSGAGTTGEQDNALTVIPHAFATLPLPKTKKGVLGIGTYSPFRVNNEWTEPNAFSGRFIAASSELKTQDVTTVVAFPLSPSVGFGAGVIYRLTTLNANRHLASSLAGTTYDVASVAMETDSTSSTGWTAGLIIRPSARFALGITHRSGMDIDFKGSGTLTQISTGDTQLDQLVAASYPFGQELALTTTLSLPAQTTAGLAIGLSKSVMIEVDATRSAWKRTTASSFAFTNNPEFDFTYPLSFEDTTSYRAGFRYALPTGMQLRLGYAIDKSPQPDATLSPFIAELDRNAVTAGIGLDWLDLAFVWTKYGDRGTLDNPQNFNGNYRGESWSFLLTATK